jgi:hypothetical protein
MRSQSVGGIEIQMLPKGGWKLQEHEKIQGAE